MKRATEVTQLMLDQLRELRFLYQEMVVYEISALFGEGFVHENANGNLAINKDVLKEFRKLTGDSVIWSRSDRCWRPRYEHDEPGRQQW